MLVTRQPEWVEAVDDAGKLVEDAAARTAAPLNFFCTVERRRFFSLCVDRCLIQRVKLSDFGIGIGDVGAGAFDFQSAILVELIEQGIGDNALQRQKCFRAYSHIRQTGFRIGRQVLRTSADAVPHTGQCGGIE